MFPKEIFYKGHTYVQEEDVINPVEHNFTRRIKHDWERRDWTGKVLRPNLPEVFRCGKINDYDGETNRIVNGHYTELTEEWQFFWFDICCKSFYGKYHNQLTRDEYRWFSLRWTVVGGDGVAFTNGHGLDKYKNYVAGLNSEQNENPAIYTLICGGACITEKRVVINKYGQKMLEMPAFDGTQPPPDVKTIDIKNDPRIFTAVSITSTVVPTGGYSINPFPQFRRDNTSQDVLIPLIASSPIYYPLDYTEEINSDRKLNPYNAPKPIFQAYPQ